MGCSGWVRISGTTSRSFRAAVIGGSAVVAMGALAMTIRGRVAPDAAKSATMTVRRDHQRRRCRSRPHPWGEKGPAALKPKTRAAFNRKRSPLISPVEGPGQRPFSRFAPVIQRVAASRQLASGAECRIHRSATAAGWQSELSLSLIVVTPRPTSTYLPRRLCSESRIASLSCGYSGA